MQLEHAIFRNEDDFSPTNLQHHLPFWEHEILKDHPHKQAILGWLKGVKLEEFLNSVTSTHFRGQQLYSYYPQPNQFEHYIPSEFQDFMKKQVQEWINSGVLKSGMRLKLPLTQTSLQWSHLWE
jgi:hypothetical protein